jgi:hypothetical protein
MASFFGSGSPRQWYNSVKLSQPHLLNDFSLFCQQFKSHFGNPNVASEATRKIQDLEQTGSAAAYSARFHELVVHVKWNDEVKIHFFYQNLKTSVKDMIANTKVNDQPTDFKQYSDWVIDIDNRIHDRELERKAETKSTKQKSTPSYNNSTPRHSSTPSYVPPPPSTSSALPPGEPMEIDASKTSKFSKARGPLTTEEKERRRKNKLCMYCGGSNHFADSCPNMSEAAKKRLAASKASSQSGKA